ncbi:MAG: peptidoglycan-binding protein [Cyanobacteria bacterium P01_F01_bin.86]
MARDALESEQEILLAQSSDNSGQLDSSDDASASQVTSNQVKNLQRRLTELGFYSGAIDGVYGPNTQGALAEFQESTGLAATGIVDPLTQERLNSSTTSSLLPNIESDASLETSEADASTSEAADSDSTFEVAQNDAESAPDEETNSSEGEAATPEGEESAEAESTNNTDSNGSGADQQEQGLFRLALIGLAIVVFGGLGGTALLLARRGSASPEANEEEAVSGGLSSRSEPSISPVYTETTRNGSSQLAPPTKTAGSASIKRHTTTLSTGSASTPRLAKVNIVDELIQDLNNPNPGIRRKAIWELGQRGNSTAVQPLVGLIVNADSHEQCLILAALAEIGAQTLKPMNRALVLSLQSENPEVRKNAIRDLTRIYDLMGHVGRALGQAASDEDPDVRQTAQWALNQLNRMRLAPTESAGLLQESKASVEPFSDNRSPTMETLPEGSTGMMDHFSEASSMESLPGDEASSRTLS